MSTSVATKTQYTPEDLLAMPDGKSYELVGGQLVERKMGIESSWVAGRVTLTARPVLRGASNRMDLAGRQTAISASPTIPARVRKPDVSFVRYGRFPGGVLPEGWAKIPPDLAVEVVSPNDTAYELDEKLDDYQKVGVPLVWVINPKSRTVMVHRGDGSVSHLREDDELSGEDVIPGFRCPMQGDSSATRAFAGSPTEPEWVERCVIPMLGSASVCR